MKKTKNPLPDNTKPYVRVTPVSRKEWKIELIDPYDASLFPLANTVWYRRNEKSAGRKGEKELARYILKYRSLSAGFTIQ